MNKMEEHFVKYRKTYLFSILLLVLILPLISREWNSQPLIIGPESYYHLSQAQHSSWKEFYYFPLRLLTSFHSELPLLLTQLLLSILCLALSLSLLKKLEFDSLTSSLLILFLVLSPTFIFTFISVSAYSWYWFLFLLGFWLITQNQQKVRYLGIIPFMFTTLTNLGSSLFTLLSLGVYYWHTKNNSLEHKRMVEITLIITIFTSLLSLWIFNVSPLLGPFYPVNSISELISDLGGVDGTPFFVFLLGVIGIGSVWKNKHFLWVYLFLLLTIILYLLNPHYIFLLSLVIIFFSVQGYQKIFSSSWSLETLKKFTALLVLLGLFFSVISFTNRLGEFGPNAEDREALTWIKDNLPKDTPNQVIFSLPEESYYIRYFAQYEPFYDYHLYRDNQNQMNATSTLLTSSYISTTFPILEDHSVNIIYVSAKLNQSYPEEEGLLYLLKNERFKLVHSNDKNQVWVFS